MFEFIVSLSPYCKVPLYTLPRIVLSDQLISVRTCNEYIVREKYKQIKKYLKFNDAFYKNTQHSLQTFQSLCEV